jgi:hypothetical protein
VVLRPDAFGKRQSAVVDFEPPSENRVMRTVQISVRFKTMTDHVTDATGEPA